MGVCNADWVTLPLEAVPASVAKARHFVSEIVGRCAGKDVVDAAELVTSEVVTNAVLHAGASIRIVVRPAGRKGVRIEVFDGSELPLSRPHFDPGESSVGRGLELVDALCNRWGVEPTSTGKLVWMELGDVGNISGIEQEDWSDTGASGWRLVQFLGLPPDLVEVALAHSEALLRELALISFTSEVNDVDIKWQPLRIPMGEITQAVSAALAEGRQAADLEVLLPAGSAHAARVRLEMIEQADGLAVTGVLLCPPAVPEVISARRWIYREIVNQLEGAEPTPWQEAPHPTSGRSNLSSDISHFTPANVAAFEARGPWGVAVDYTNSIVYIGSSVAEMLGWNADELVGKRLTAIIPPELRQAHIAGFTRHQLTGEVRIMDRPLPVEALCKDGRRLPITLRVGLAGWRDAHPLYIATIKPRETRSGSDPCWDDPG